MCVYHIEGFKYSGELNIIEGSFFYNGNEFVNLNGNIYLDPTEFNPELDIGGIDAAHKLVLLSKIVFHQKTSLSDVKITGIKDVDLKLVWDPPWTKEKMSEAAKLELNL